MEPNVFYYTCSTICQSLAGAFGFLLAVILYHIQSINSSLTETLTAAGRKRSWTLEGDIEWKMARATQNWSQMHDLFIRYPRIEDPNDWQGLETVFGEEHFKRVFSELTAIKKAARASAKRSLLAIVFSLFLLPFSKLLADGPQAIGIPLLVVAVALAIEATRSFIPLITKVISHQAPILGSKTLAAALPTDLRTDSDGEMPTSASLE